MKVEPLADAITWAPSLPASGTYQVYAKWTADETRATDARYSIVHSGGTAAVSVNQRVGGGLWHYLGSYAFDPLSNPTVTLAANDNGSVAADAIRFVGGPGGATDVAYLHTDHLGTPQAMTDANAQVLWWRDQTPFGQTVTTGGFSQNPLRFPGQFADAESGLAYNYFRDYDPALGRYIQSDPIGLRGGLNTYGYVGGNPVRYVDSSGQFTELALGSCIAGGPLNPVCDVAIIVNGCKWIVIGGGVVVATIMLSEDTCEDCAKEHDDDRKALNDLINEATNGGRKPLSSDDADTIIDWANEQGIGGVRDDRGTGHWEGGDHIHVPGSGIRHIPAN
ncbi:RHS repeat-associated core domain-containing protein [Pelagibius sp. CAU 1746]|uniref:RHS repeat-associated core domain-containing protein n=1 Tax=Pelagibius sp. CAU 1746 TaxID=3140370 RepID=UPI00325AF3F4